ncbi:MAG: phosphate acyltransferase PlsX [bacterium]
MKLAIDAMSGDIGPKVIIEGAIEAAREFNVSLFLIGQEELLKKELAQFNTEGLSIVVKHASQVITMDDEISVALRKKKDSSTMVAANLVKQKEAHGMISAGNTGAVMAIAKINFKGLEGVERPAIATTMPTKKGVSILLDVGANADCKPIHLHQFAVMGHIYARQILHIETPRIGLLNIGEEEGKGNDLTKETYKLFKAAPFYFVGNVEGRDIFEGNVDVIVTDGFTGNVALKVGESVAELITDLIKNEISNKLLAQVGAFLMKPIFHSLKKKIDHAEYGGAPLLGLNDVCIICHGGSGARAIFNSIRIAKEFISQEVNEKIKFQIGANLKSTTPVCANQCDGRTM